MMDVGIHYDTYCNNLDNSIYHKVEIVCDLLSKCPNLSKDSTIVDVGCGTGLLIFKLAKIMKFNHFVGLDQSDEMILRCQKHGKRGRVSFVKCNVNDGTLPKSDVFIFSSILHEIFSYGDDCASKVEMLLKKAFDSLTKGGCVIIRDFVKPSNGNQKVLLRHRKSDMHPSHEFEQFCYNFHKVNKKRQPLLNWMTNHPFCKTYSTNMETAYEFMFRKDYNKNWDSEMQEKYGFLTTEEYITLLLTIGYKIIFCETIDNDFIKQTRLKHKIVLFDADNHNIVDYPKYQIHIVAMK